MNDVTDLTLLSGLMQETQREMRLLRLQTDNLVSRLAIMDQRVATLEQGFHALLAELSRSQGQMQQQITRVEKRIEAVDVGLTEIRGELASGMDRVIEAITRNKHD